jgi:hypothetical protein
MKGGLLCGRGRLDGEQRHFQTHSIERCWRGASRTDGAKRCRPETRPEADDRRGDPMAGPASAKSHPRLRWEPVAVGGPRIATESVYHHGRSMGRTNRRRRRSDRQRILDAGEHKIRSRATDVDGSVQPTPEAPVVASRRTFWENNGHINRRGAHSLT